jgi:hypothetical protein
MWTIQILITNADKSKTFMDVHPSYSKKPYVYNTEQEAKHWASMLYPDIDPKLIRVHEQGKE